MNPKIKFPIRDKDYQHRPSLACKYHLNYDRCRHPEAPRPSHSRCVGSLICEEWYCKYA